MSCCSYSAGNPRTPHVIVRTAGPARGGLPHWGPGGAERAPLIWDNAPPHHAHAARADAWLAGLSSDDVHRLTGLRSSKFDWLPTYASCTTAASARLRGASRLGHADIGTTVNIYGHLSAKKKRDAALHLGNLLAARGHAGSSTEVLAAT